MKNEKIKTEKNHILLFSITGVHWLLILPENSWCVDFSTEKFRMLSFRCVGIFQLGQTCSFINTRLSHGHFKGRLMLGGGNDVEDGIRSYKYLFSNQTGPNLGRASEVTRALGSGAFEFKAKSHP